MLRGRYIGRVVKGRGYRGKALIRGLIWIVLYIRLFDLKNAIIGHKMGQNRRQIFCFQLVSVA